MENCLDDLMSTFEDSLDLMQFVFVSGFKHATLPSQLPGGRVLMSEHVLITHGVHV